MTESNSSTKAINYLLHKNGWIDIPSSGTSMYPLIKEKDICRFVPIHPEEVKKGDILLFLSDQGYFICHRYFRRVVKDGIVYYSFKGDTNYLHDPLVRESQLIGKLSVIKKKHFHLTSRNLIVQFWKMVVLAMPKLPIYIKHYLPSRPTETVWRKDRYHV